jgi:hypothetical protein
LIKLIRGEGHVNRKGTAHSRLPQLTPALLRGVVLLDALRIDR